jgi:hypothetical protein
VYLPLRALFFKKIFNLGDDFFMVQPKVIIENHISPQIILPPDGVTIADVRKMTASEFRNMPVQELAGLILNSIPEGIEANIAPFQSERKARTDEEIKELANILQPYQQTMTPQALNAMVTAIQQSKEPMTNREIADFAKTFQTYQNAMK